MATRFPSFNGIEAELYRSRKGFGLGVQTVEKINGCPHVLHALGVTLNNVRPLVDQAVEACETLVDVIEAAVDGREHQALIYNLNLDRALPCYKWRLTERQLELQQVLQIGRRQRTTLETGAFRLLTDHLFQNGRKRRP